MDVHLVHSVCSVYEAFWPVIFVAFRVFVAFMGHRGWTLEAFTELLVFRFVGLDVAGVGQHLWHLWGVCVVRLGTWVLFRLCMLLHAQHRWVPPGLVYWGSGFSQP